MLYPVHLARVVLKLTTLVVIDTDCINSYKSNNTEDKLVLLWEN
jgi:hypothetical protein